MIKEMFFIRAIACLSIVLLHSISIGINTSSKEEIGIFSYFLLDSLNIILYFGTPMFIFLSIFLLAYSYRQRSLPENFLSKRFLYIFLPFTAMALFYAIPHATTLWEGIQKFFLNTLIGDYHGYFVLIIFQFYILYLFFRHLLQKSSPILLITVSFIINAAYLSLFNFTPAPSIPFGEYIWERFYWVPFLGWIFYFTLGYYCGYYYETFVAYLKKYHSIVLAAPIFSVLLLLFFYHSEFITIHSSKRIDMLFHTTAVFFFLFYVTSQLKHVPSLIINVSKYSFGIYLIHMFYIAVVEFFSGFFPPMNGFVQVFFLFIFSTSCSMITTYYINKWRYGKYILGKVGLEYDTKTSPTFSPSVSKKQKLIKYS